MNHNPRDRRAPLPPPLPGVRTVGQERVEDDLSWMREVAHRDELRAYLKSERDFYDESTADFEPLRQALSASARQRHPDAARTPSWTVAGAKHFFRWPPHHEYPQLVRKSEDSSETSGSETILLDGEDLSTTGFLRLGECSVSPDGRWLAYSVDVLGNEEYDLRVRDTWAGTDLPGSTPHTYYGLQWLPDSTGFLYARHDAAYRPHQVWLHRVHVVGTPDHLVYEEIDERFYLLLRASGDGQHAIIRSAARLTAEERLIDLVDPTSAPITTLGRTEGLDYTLEPVVEDDRVALFVVLNDTHDEYRLVRGILGNAMATYVELFAGDPHQRLREVSWHDGHLVLQGRRSGQACLWVFPVDTAGAPYAIGPDELGGTVCLEPYDADGPGTICLATESRRTPRVWYSLDLATRERREIGRTPAGEHRADDYLQETLDVTAADGTEVPVTVLRRSGVQLDGTAPCLLYGYGAWEHVIEPAFDPALLAVLDTGVVFAHAHVRGGGELGRRWWLEGRMEHKQQTFSDFADVADHLAAGLVDGSKIVAKGLSAGGLLVGAAYSQRPDRWLGVIAEAPFVDPATTMSDETAPLVITERDEWGDPRRQADRDWMLAWSPYDNPPALPRPALLVTSAVNDPRVSVWEPARWVARLRRTGSADARVLFRCDLGARGHWPPPGRRARLEFEVDLLAWAAHLMKG